MGTTMSKKMKAYEIRYRSDNAGTSDADIENVVVVSVSKSQAIIDLVNENSYYCWIDNIRKLTEFEVDTSTNNLGNNMTDNKEVKEVIEGLLKALSRYEYLSNQYKQCLPAIEKAKTFLNGEEV